MVIAQKNQNKQLVAFDLYQLARQNIGKLALNPATKDQDLLRAKRTLDKRWQELNNIRG